METIVLADAVKRLLPDRSLFHLPYPIDGKQTDLFVLKNNNNMYAAITNYGGRLVSLLVPDKDNQLTDVIVGPDSIDRFRSSNEHYFGATIGRFANRIAEGRFKIDEEEYLLSRNENDTTLHGGVKGFQDVVWDAVQTNERSLQLNYFSPDKEEGFPGNLWVEMIFSLTDANELKIEYRAETDKKTIVSLTNHAFFNLNGQDGSQIFDHLLKINADTYTPVDKDLIPLGTIEPVAQSAFDFRAPTLIMENLDRYDLDSYDHNFVLNQSGRGKMNHAVTLISVRTGIQMNVYTNEPCLLFYSGGGMKGENVLKHGKKDSHATALVLETHQYPDAPNQPDFPSCFLEPGTIFQTASVYGFEVRPVTP